MRANNFVGIGVIMVILLTACEENLIKKQSGPLSYRYISSFHNSFDSFLKVSVNPDGTTDIYSAPTPNSIFDPWKRSKLDMLGSLISENSISPLQTPRLIEANYGFEIFGIGYQSNPANATVIDNENNVLIFTPSGKYFSGTFFSAISKFDPDLKHIVTKAIPVQVGSPYLIGGGKIYSTSDGGFITRANVLWSETDVNQDTMYVTKVDSQLNAEFTVKISLNSFVSSPFQAFDFGAYSNTFIESNGKFYFVFPAQDANKLYEFNASGIIEKSNIAFLDQRAFAVPLQNGNFLICSNQDIYVYSSNLSSRTYKGSVQANADGYLLYDIYEFFGHNSGAYYSGKMYNAATNKSKLRLGYVDSNFAVTYKDYDFGAEPYVANSTPLPEGGFLVNVMVLNGGNNTERLHFKVDADLNVVK
jgi:hypothetical protein